MSDLKFKLVIHIICFSILTVFALALLDLRLVLDALVAGLAVEPGPANVKHCLSTYVKIWDKIDG